MLGMPETVYAPTKIYTEPKTQLLPAHVHQWDIYLHEGKVIAGCVECPATMSYTELLVILNEAKG